MKKLFLILLIASIIIIGCDRFERNFVAPMTIEEFIYQFSTSATRLLINGAIDSLVVFYSAYYKNNGFRQDDVIKFFDSKEWTEQAKISISQQSRSNTITFGVEIKDAGIPFDTTWVDVARLESGKFVWYGNQTDPIVMPKQVVVAQVLTSLDCSACPTVKRRLLELQESFQERLIFLKYHTRFVLPDSLALYDDFREEAVYYGSPATRPIAIFQGEIIRGGSPADMEQYYGIIQRFASEYAEVKLSNLTHSVNNRTITGSVVLNFADLNTENLYLHYAVYEKETNAVYLRDRDVRAGHVVRGRGLQALNDYKDGEAVNFEFVSERFLDDDTYLVVWVQRMQNLDRRTDSDRILNAIKIRLF